MKNYIKVLLTLIIVSILLRWFYSSRIYDIRCDGSANRDNLENNGFIILPNVISPQTIKRYKSLIAQKKMIKIKQDIFRNTNLTNTLSAILGTEYEFQDYVMVIIKSLVHTCHRDYNGDFFNQGQTHKSYTMLIFLENMERSLDVVPKSHKSIFSNMINLTDPTISIRCQPGDAILFDANLIHAGSFNEKLDNMRIQLKITHRDDKSSIDYYEKYNKYIDKKNNVPLFLKKIQKHITCQFPVFSDISQQVGINDSNKGSEISTFQKIFATLFYANPNYYVLPESK